MLGIMFLQRYLYNIVHVKIRLVTEKKFVILANKKIIMTDDGDNESSNYGGNISKILPTADNYKDGNYQLVTLFLITVVMRTKESIP